MNKLTFSSLIICVYSYAAVNDIIPSDYEAPLANSTVNLTSSGGVVLKLTAGSTAVSNYASMLKNDITTLKNVSLAAGESKEVVVLFQVKESDANSLAGLVMSATSSGTSLGSLTIN